jgi:hypothetical protein
MCPKWSVVEGVVVVLKAVVIVESRVTGAAEIMTLEKNIVG